MVDNLSGQRRHSWAKRALAAGLIGICLLVGGQLLYQHVTQPVYTTTIDQFVSAMQSDNAAKVQSLESAAFQAKIRAASAAFNATSNDTPITANYDAYCKTLGQYCTDDFTSQYLNQAKMQLQKVTKGGTVVSMVRTYAIVTSVATVDDDTNEPGTAESSVKISVVPAGSRWLIDNVVCSNFSL